MTIRLLDAGDQAMVRQRFGALLNAQQGMAVVGGMSALRRRRVQHIAVAVRVGDAAWRPHGVSLGPSTTTPAARTAATSASMSVVSRMTPLEEPAVMPGKGLCSRWRCRRLGSDLQPAVVAPSGLEGKGFPVRRAFVGVDLAALDPFAHIDQMGEVDYAPGEPKGIPWHPHRGFETVTYMIDGIFQHQDSNGGGGFITDSDTRWMTAGAGLSIC
jgi:Pirin